MSWDQEGMKTSTISIPWHRSAAICIPGIFGELFFPCRHNIDLGLLTSRIPKHTADLVEKPSLHTMDMEAAHEDTELFVRAHIWIRERTTWLPDKHATSYWVPAVIIAMSMKSPLRGSSSSDVLGPQSYSRSQAKRFPKRRKRHNWLPTIRLFLKLSPLAFHHLSFRNSFSSTAIFRASVLLNFPKLSCQMKAERMNQSFWTTRSLAGSDFPSQRFTQHHAAIVWWELQGQEMEIYDKGN